MAEKVKKTENQLTEEQYLQFMATVSSSKQKVDDANVANAQNWKRTETYGIHSAAAKDILKLRKMDAAKREDYLRSLRIYLAWEKFDEQLDMFEDAPEQGRDEVDMFRHSLDIQEEEAFINGTLLVCEGDDGNWYAFNESAKYLADSCGRGDDIAAVSPPDLGEVMMFVVADETTDRVVEEANKAGHCVLMVDINGEWVVHDPIENASEPEPETPVEEEPIVEGSVDEYPEEEDIHYPEAAE